MLKSYCEEQREKAVSGWHASRTLTLLIRMGTAIVQYCLGTKMIVPEQDAVADHSFILP